MNFAEVKREYKQGNATQEKSLPKDIRAKSWGDLAIAVRKKAKGLESVADAFERYQAEGEPFPGDTEQSGLSD